MNRRTTWLCVKQSVTESRVDMQAIAQAWFRLCGGCALQRTSQFALMWVADGCMTHTNAVSAGGGPLVRGQLCRRVLESFPAASAILKAWLQIARNFILNLFDNTKSSESTSEKNVPTCH